MKLQFHALQFGPSFSCPAFSVNPSTHCTYQRKDDQAEWAWVVWINTRMPERVVTNPSTKQTRPSLTLLICPMPLPLCQTSHCRGLEILVQIGTLRFVLDGEQHNAAGSAAEAVDWSGAWTVWERPRFSHRDASCSVRKGEKRGLSIVTIFAFSGTASPAAEIKLWFWLGKMVNVRSGVQNYKRWLKPFVNSDVSVKIRPSHNPNSLTYCNRTLHNSLCPRDEDILYISYIFYRCMFVYNPSFSTAL